MLDWNVLFSSCAVNLEVVSFAVADDNLPYAYPFVFPPPEKR